MRKLQGLFLKGGKRPIKSIFWTFHIALKFACCLFIWTISLSNHTCPHHQSLSFEGGSESLKSSTGRSWATLTQSNLGRAKNAIRPWPDFTGKANNSFTPGMGRKVKPASCCSHWNGSGHFRLLVSRGSRVPAPTLWDSHRISGLLPEGCLLKRKTE